MTVEIFSDIPLPARQRPTGKGPTGKYPFDSLGVGQCFPVESQITHPKNGEPAMETATQTLSRAISTATMQNRREADKNTTKYFSARKLEDGRVFIWRTDKRPEKQESLPNVA